MTDIPSTIGNSIRSFHKEKDPIAVLYICKENAILGLKSPLGILGNCPGIVYNLEWVPEGALLLIVWEMKDPDQVLQVLRDLASNSHIPVSVLV